MPDAGGTWALPRLVGAARARGLAMLAEPLNAEKAEAWGLIWKVVDDDKFEAEVAAVAGRLANAATYGIALTKRALAQSTTNTLADNSTSSATCNAWPAPRPMPQKGIRAFLREAPAEVHRQGAESKK